MHAKSISKVSFRQAYVHLFIATSCGGWGVFHCSLLYAFIKLSNPVEFVFTQHWKCAKGKAKDNLITYIWYVASL